MSRGDALQAGLCVALACAAVSVHAASRPITVDIDPAKTRIEWTLGDVLHTIRGTFQLKQGRIIYNPEARSISGEIVVDTASGDSGNGTRDRRMKKEILETQRFPEARFVPAGSDAPIALNGASEVHISGILDLHGTKHDVTIPLKIEFSGSDVKATGSFTIPYVQWGMKNPSTFVLRVDQTVRVDVRATGRLSSSTAADARRSYTPRDVLSLTPLLARVSRE